MSFDGAGKLSFCAVERGLSSFCFPVFCGCVIPLNWIPLARVVASRTKDHQNLRNLQEHFERMINLEDVFTGSVTRPVRKYQKTPCQSSVVKNKN